MNPPPLSHPGRFLARRGALALIGAVVLLAWVSPALRAQIGGQPFDPRTTRGLKYVDPSLDDDLFPIQLAGYWGLMNQHGFITVLPRYDWTDVGVEGFARAVQGGRTGFLTGNGEWGIDPVFEYADRFEEGYAVFGRGGRYGYINKAGKVQLEPKLDGALRFREGRAAIRRGNRIAFIDVGFRLVTGWSFTAARSYHDGFAAVRVLDPDHVTTDPPKRNNAQDQNRDNDPKPASTTPDDGSNPAPDDPQTNPQPWDTARQLRDRGGRDPFTSPPGVWGYLDQANRMVFVDKTGTIQELGDFHENLARFRRGDKWGFLRKDFSVALEPTFEDARDFTGGVAAVKQGGKWGYIDKSFSLVVPPTYDAADDFDQTLAMVRLGDLYGYILRTGRVEITPQFKDARPFFKSIARVAVDDTFGYINVAAQIIFDPRDARFGITDVTLYEKARRSVRRYRPGNTVLRLPDARPPLPEPYPPEYLYEELLVAPR